MRFYDPENKAHANSRGIVKLSHPTIRKGHGECPSLRSQLPPFVLYQFRSSVP